MKLFSTERYPASVSRDVSSRKVLVTGASSAIGIEVCRQYLSTGHRVAAHFNKNESSLAENFQSESRLTRIHCDFSDLEAVSAFAHSHSDADIVVFLSSLARPSSINEIDVQGWHHSMAIGGLSSFIILGVLGPHMVERGWGRFVIGSSIGVKFGGGEDSFAYALSNHTREFIPQAARKWTSSNVFTNVVRIGVTDTDLHKAFPNRDWNQRLKLIPAQRAAAPREVAEFIAWYGSDRNTYVSGQILSISGGE